MPIKRLFNSPILQIIICLGLIACLTYLFLWRLWASETEDRAYLPEKSDLAEVFYPPRYFLAKSLATGEFPLWNPHVYAGYPQFADPQAATFYPIALLLAWLAGNNFSMDTLAFDIGLHFFLTGASAFLFFRHIFKSNGPALLSALTFEFGGYLTYYPPLQLSELEVVPWFTVTLLLSTLALEKRSWRWMALAGLSFGTVFLAGRPQSYLTIGLISFAWIIYTAHQLGYSWLQSAQRLIFLSGFALGVAAVQWLPTLELTRLSTRSVLTYATVSEGGFPFEQLLGFFVPQLLGTQNLYVGLLTLILASLAIVERRGLFWLGIGLVCVFGSVGKHLILFDGIYLIERLGFPGYLRNVERLAFGITFSLAALSGYGLQVIRSNAKTAFRISTVTTGGIGLLIVLLVWLWHSTRPLTENTNSTLSIDTLAFVGLVLGSGLFVQWLLKSYPTIIQITLAVIALVDVMSINQGRFLVPQAFIPGNDIERVASAPSGQNAPYRITFDQTSSQDFGSLVGVDNVRGMPPLMLTDYDRLLKALNEYRRNILLNVEIVVTTGVYADPAFELITQQDNFNYYRFLAAKPRAYLADTVIDVPDPATAAKLIAAPDFDHWYTAIVLGQTGLAKGPDLSSVETAEITERTANKMVIQVTTESPRLLVIADAFYPGWRAELNGTPTTLYQTNVALRGVVVPIGTHSLTLQFQPTTFWLGLSISTLTLIGLLLWWVWPSKSKLP